MNQGHSLLCGRELHLSGVGRGLSGSRGRASSLLRLRLMLVHALLRGLYQRPEVACVIDRLARLLIPLLLHGQLA